MPGRRQGTRRGRPPPLAPLAAPSGMPPSESINCFSAASRSPPSCSARRTDQALRRLRLHEARRDGDDAHALRSKLVRQALAVGAERRFGGGIGRVASYERQSTLDRGDVQDHALAAFGHRRRQKPVEPDGRIEVCRECLFPRLVGRRSEATGRRGRPADHMDDPVDPARAPSARRRRQPSFRPPSRCPRR